MTLDLSAIAAQAAKAKGADAKSVGQLPDSADEFIAQLVDDDVLDLGQATALRLLIGKAKVAAVAEAVKRAMQNPGEVASQNLTVNSTAEIIEDRPPEQLEAEARALDEREQQRIDAERPFASDRPQLPADLDAQLDAMQNEGGQWG